MLAVAPPPPTERQHLIAQARSALLCRVHSPRRQEATRPGASVAKVRPGEDRCCRIYTPVARPWG